GGTVAEPLLNHWLPDEGGDGKDQAEPETVAEHRYGMAGVLVVRGVFAMSCVGLLSRKHAMGLTLGGCGGAVCLMAGGVRVSVAVIVAQNSASLRLSQVEA